MIEIFNIVNNSLIDLKCEICQKCFIHEAVFKRHLNSHKQNSASKVERKINAYNCEHEGCDLVFKTKGRKLMHHNKQEVECKGEKNATIKLIAQYKRLILRALSVQGDNTELESLKKQYESTVECLHDDEYLTKICGQTFDETL